MKELPNYLILLICLRKSVSISSMKVVSLIPKVNVESSPNTRIQLNVNAINLQALFVEFKTRIFQASKLELPETIRISSNKSKH